MLLYCVECYLCVPSRAEMHNPEVAVRYGLMLEAYCRGCPSHMEKLSAQVNLHGSVCNVTAMSFAEFDRLMLSAS